MPKLQKLSLESCTNLDPVSATAILSNERICPRLQHLNLRRCEQLVSADITAIVSSHRNLKELNLFGIDFFNMELVISIAQILYNARTILITPDLNIYSVHQWIHLQDQFKCLGYDVI